MVADGSDKFLHALSRTTVRGWVMLRHQPWVRASGCKRTVGRGTRVAGMRETELWRRLEHHLGANYALSWAENYALAPLGGRTVREALAAGMDVKAIWRAVWAALELPASAR